MGARYLICVVKDGLYRIAQYGHDFQYGKWPDTFESEGKRIIRFLGKTDLEWFSWQVDNVKVLTADQVRARWEAARDEARRSFGYDLPLEALHFCPEYGTAILNYVVKADAPEVYHSLDFAGDGLFCEFAYVVNLDTRSLEVFTGFNRAPLAEQERFHGFEKHMANQADFARRSASGKPYYPIKHFRTIPFAELSACNLALPVEQG